MSADGCVWTVPEQPRLFDVGDVRIHQGDVQAQIEAIAAPVAEITARGAMPVVIGGDHFVPYPSFIGFARGLRAAKPGAKVGFLNIDGHFDFWDEFRDMGRLNHGTFARRISEHEAVGNMVWWGLNGTNIARARAVANMQGEGFCRLHGQLDSPPRRARDDARGAGDRLRGSRSRVCDLRHRRHRRRLCSRDSFGSSWTG